MYSTEISGRVRFWSFLDIRKKVHLMTSFCYQFRLKHSRNIALFNPQVWRNPWGRLELLSVAWLNNCTYEYNEDGYIVILLTICNVLFYSFWRLIAAEKDIFAAVKCLKLFIQQFDLTVDTTESRGFQAPLLRQNN